MNQRELSFLHRGVLLLLAGGGTIVLLSKVDYPWAKDASTLGGVVLWIGGIAFIIFTTFRGFGRFLRAPIRDEPQPQGISDTWYHLAQLAVAVSVLLVLTFVAAVLLVAPAEQCPDWSLPGKHPMFWWGIFLWSGSILAGLIFILVRWKWFLRKAIEIVDYPTTMPVSCTLIITVLGGCAMAQLPWIDLFGKCWPGG